jgi:hypothetical protein
MAVLSLVVLYWAGGRAEPDELAPSSQAPPTGGVRGSEMRTKEAQSFDENQPTRQNVGPA